MHIHSSQAYSRPVVVHSYIWTEHRVAWQASWWRRPKNLSFCFMIMQEVYQVQKIPGRRQPLCHPWFSYRQYYSHKTMPEGSSNIFELIVLSSLEKCDITTRWKNWSCRVNHFTQSDQPQRNPSTYMAVLDRRHRDLLVCEEKPQRPPMGLGRTNRALSLMASSL